MKILFLAILFVASLFADVEGEWRLDWLKSHEKNGPDRSWQGFTGMTLIFNEGTLSQNGVEIARYRFDNETLFERQGDGSWSPSALLVKGRTLELPFGTATLCFSPYNAEEEARYTFERNITAINPADFYRDDTLRYNDTGKLPWHVGDIFDTLNGIESVYYRVYKTVKDAAALRDFHFFNVRRHSHEVLQYRRFGLSQNDWIDMDWHTYRRNPSRKPLPFSPLFGTLQPFHVVGKEVLDTPAGRFACTRVEGIETPWDAPVIAWMIDDRPGIYAKVLNFKEKRLYVLDHVKETP